MSRAVESSVPYHIEGYLLYIPEAGQPARFKRAFRVSVDGCDWSVRVDGEASNEIDYYEEVHLGNTIYYYKTFRKTPQNTFAANSGVATVENGDVPVSSGSFASYVWLGFASACYFHASTNKEIQPIWVARDIRNTRVKADWTVGSEPPFLPTHVAYYQKPGLMPVPYDAGWKAAELRVVSSTNSGGLVIPSDFTYEQFRPKENGARSSDIVSQFQVRVVAEKFRVGDTPIAPPNTLGVTVVDERRFTPLTTVSGVTYATSNKTLPITPEKAALQQYELLKKAPSPEPPSDRRIRMVILCVMALSAGFVLVVIMRRTSKRERST